MNQGLAGFRPLLRVALRQDACAIALWIVLITALSVSSVLAYDWIFTDTAPRASLAATVGANPAFSLIFGIMSPTLPPSHPNIPGWRSWQFLRSPSLGLALSAFAAAMCCRGKPLPSRKSAKRTRFLPRRPCA